MKLLVALVGLVAGKGLAGEVPIKVDPADLPVFYGRKAIKPESPEGKRLTGKYEGKTVQLTAVVRSYRLADRKEGQGRTLAFVLVCKHDGRLLTLTTTLADPLALQASWKTRGRGMQLVADVQFKASASYNRGFFGFDLADGKVVGTRSIPENEDVKP